MWPSAASAQSSWGSRVLAVTEAGVDTWSPSWYANPDGPARAFFDEFGTVRGPSGSQLLPEAIAGHRVGWFKGGLVFAEGHPSPDGLCPAGELTVRALGLQDALLSAGLPIDRFRGLRRFASSAASAEGWAGLRRADATLNLDAGTRGEGLAVLAGIAACVRDAPGHAEVRYGLDHAVETVYLRGYGGKRVLGRWYDKGLEASSAYRGRRLRGEDQRRWGKLDRRDPWDLDAHALRSGFQRRFYPLWQATRGVTVAGPVVIAEKLLEAVREGSLSPREAEALCGHVVLRVVGGRRGGGISQATMYRREKRIREFGLQLADGVLEEVELDLASVLEQVLETDAWGASG
jgi:hypothetical protein